MVIDSADAELAKIIARQKRIRWHHEDILFSSVNVTANAGNWLTAYKIRGQNPYQRRYSEMSQKLRYRHLAHNDLITTMHFRQIHAFVCLF